MEAMLNADSARNVIPVNLVVARGSVTRAAYGFEVTYLSSIALHFTANCNEQVAILLRK